MADDVQNRVKKIIVNHLGISESKIQDNAKFIEDLGASSAEKIITVKDAVDFIQKQTS